MKFEYYICYDFDKTGPMFKLVYTFVDDKCEYVSSLYDDGEDSLMFETTASYLVLTPEELEEILRADDTIPLLEQHDPFNFIIVDTTVRARYFKEMANGTKTL